MNSPNNREIILSVLSKKKNVNKTTLMKIIYMLQQVKEIKLGYDFDLYLYGPYSAEAADDLNTLIHEKQVDSVMYLYQRYVGYQLSITANGIRNLPDLPKETKNGIEEIVRFVEDKNAKDMELYATIIYVHQLYHQNKWKNEKNAVISNVKEIKPHFNVDVINDAYLCLKEKDYLKP